MINDDMRKVVFKSRVRRTQLLCVSASVPLVSSLGNLQQKKFYFADFCMQWLCSNYHSIAKATASQAEAIASNTLQPVSYS